MVWSMNDQDERQNAAKRDLDRLRHEGDALGGFFMRWFQPSHIDTTDPIEVRGARIGRGLSVVALAAFCIYLFWTYLR